MTSSNGSITSPDGIVTSLDHAITSYNDTVLNTTYNAFNGSGVSPAEEFWR